MTAVVGAIESDTQHRWLRRIRPVAWRVLLGLVSLAIVVVIVFALAGARSPRSIALGNLPPGGRSDAAVQEYIKNHELDRPLPVRLGTFVADLARGDLGETANRVDVASIVMPAFWRTVRLVVPAFCITVLLSISLGAWLAEHAGSRVDRAVTGVLAVTDSIPVFVTGIAVLFIFAAQLGLFQISSQLALDYGSTADRFKAFVLPALTLILLQGPYATKLTRSAFADALEKPMAKSAILRGLPPRVVRWRCVLPNTASLLAHSFGLMAATMVAGSLIVENVFSFPGIGRLSVLSISAGDQPTLVAIVVVTSVWLIVVSTLSDVLAVWFDPKLR